VLLIFTIVLVLLPYYKYRGKVLHPFPPTPPLPPKSILFTHPPSFSPSPLSSFYLFPSSLSSLFLPLSSPFLSSYYSSYFPSFPSIPISSSIFLFNSYFIYISFFYTIYILFSISIYIFFSQT